MDYCSGYMSSDRRLFFWKQTLLDDATELWGIRVARVEIKDVRIPVQLQRSMAAEAEATREARAKVRNAVNMEANKNGTEGKIESHLPFQKRFCPQVYLP